MNEILQGDCLEVLKGLPDGFVDCCVTSPPYYGLRDYGTGKWVGGNPNCDHRNAVYSSRFDRAITENTLIQTTNKGTDFKRYKKICPICGAVREDKQIGLEETPGQFVQMLVEVFREVRRILKDDGTLWVNIGDSYNGSGKGRTADGKHPAASEKQGSNVGSLSGTITKSMVDTCKSKDLIGIPWMLAFALREDGWYLRQDIIWHKPNPMPESVKDRCTKSHEYIFLLSKQPHYYFDFEAIQEPASAATYKRLSQDIDNQEGSYTPGKMNGKMKAVGYRLGSTKYGGAIVRSKRDVWSITTKSCKEAHFATFPEDLIEPCILAGSRINGIVLDPFFGSGTTGVVAQKNNRNYLGIELNPEYIKIAERRLESVQPKLRGIM